MLNVIEMPDFATLQWKPLDAMTDAEFFEFCQRNRDYRIERDATGEVIMNMPAGGETGNFNAYLTAMLYVWAQIEGNGIAFDSSTGFDLADGSTYSPDASWVKKQRYNQLTAVQRKKFLPLAPDFVIELRSYSDRLKPLQRKMKKYMVNGVQLGWLIDPERQQVTVYRPNHPPQVHQSPTSISDPFLPNFELDLQPIWYPEW